MFFGSKNKSNDVDIETFLDEIDDLTEENNELKRQNEILEEKIKEIEHINSTKEENASFIIDFNKINVFSIERSKNQTVFGYLLQKKEETIAKEWYFKCSLEVHEKIAVGFLNYINSKK